MGHLFTRWPFYFIKMKEIILLLVVLVTITNTSFAQLQANSSSTTDFYSQYMVNKSSTDLYNDIDGSPYLSNKFSYGSVHYPQNNYSNINLRYNIYRDEFEFSKDNNPYVLSNPKKISYINLDEEKWVYLDLVKHDLHGYYSEIGTYINAILLKKYRVKYKSEQPAQSYKPYKKATFTETEISYYLVIDNSEVIELYLSKRKSIKKLSDKKNELKKFLKSTSNNLDSEAKLLLFVDYYLSI